MTNAKAKKRKKRTKKEDKAVQKQMAETIRICRENDILKDYLAREEAAAVMYAFADQEEAMKEALEAERAEGEALGEARGEARGKAEGEIIGVARLASLMDKLFSLGRMEDAKKAAKDETYRAELFSEFNMV